MASELRREGWSILAQNWSGGGGELDVVVRRGDVLRFVEVKARSDASLDPLEQITASKVGRLRKAAEAWLVDRDHDIAEVAFLVAIVDLASEPWSVDWVDDAFDG